MNCAQNFVQKIIPLPTISRHVSKLCIKVVAPEFSNKKIGNCPVLPQDPCHHWNCQLWHQVADNI